MGAVRLTLFGKELIFEEGTTFAHALSLSGVDLKGIACVKVNGAKKDLSTPVEDGVSVEPVPISSEEGLEVLRHTTSHILAQAVLRLYLDTKLGIGPPIENGYYYDFDFGDRRISEDELADIEKEMAKIIEEDLNIERFELGREDAISLMKDRGQIYKVELIEEFSSCGKSLSFYKQGEFIDLCEGPHLPRTGMVDHFKLLSLAGAYWRGDARGPQLQRIYGTAFDTEEKLKRHLHWLEEAKARDHRRLGVELDLFSSPAEIGRGLALFHPKGAVLRKLIENFTLEEHIRRGYQLVVTPHIYRSDIWKISGHYEFYKDNMYLFSSEDQEYGIKPMNCPGHLLIYKSKVRSYRELPIRYFEWGTVYRHELSGVLHGLMRVRSITQDDAHIFCTKAQLKEEIVKVIEFAQFMMETFGFKIGLLLSTRPEKFMGGLEIWDMATSALKGALEELSLKYNIDEGGGAFYGPKIDVIMSDALGRKWQGPTIQVDFNFPERFDLTYITNEGRQDRPVMIHRTVLGSLERFMGILLEHFNGRLPLWLAPVQIKILTITDDPDLVRYAKDVEQRFKSHQLRVETDDGKDTLGYKIRSAQIERIPYVIILGRKELESSTISVRKGKKGIQRIGVHIDELLNEIDDEIKQRVFELETVQ